MKSAWATSCCWLLLAACQPVPAPPSPPSPPAASAAASAPQAAASSAALRYVRVAQSIEVRRGDSVLQRLDIPESAEAPDIEVLDMNFDGAPDLRVVNLRPAGPNVSYINWLFDVPNQRFVRSAALDDLVAPQFDAARHEVRSQWRDGAARHGAETHAFQGGQLVPLTQDIKDYSAPGIYVLRRSRWVAGAWQLVETRSGRGE